MTSRNEEMHGSVHIVNRHGKKQLVNIDELLIIDETAISEAFSKQAALYAYYSTELAEADARVAFAKKEVEEQYALADQAVRAEFAASGTRTTETQVRNEVILDEEYSAASENLIEQERNRDVLKAIVRALDSRADMLVSLGATLRAEQQMTGISINDLREQLKKNRE